METYLTQATYCPGRSVLIDELDYAPTRVLLPWHPVLDIRPVKGGVVKPVASEKLLDIGFLGFEM